MLDRWSRLAPLTGVLAAVLAVAGAVIEIVTNPPGTDASGAQVLAFYKDNFGAQLAAVILLGFAFIFLVFFAASLRSYVRTTQSLETLGTLVLAGAIVELVGQSSGGSITLLLLDPSNHFSPATAQILNVFGGLGVLINASGFFLLTISAGLAILRGARLPKWLAWPAIVIGIVVLTPLEGFAVLALVIWLIVVSLLMYVRSGAHTQEAPVAHPTTEGAASA